RGGVRCNCPNSALVATVVEWHTSATVGDVAPSAPSVLKESLVNVRKLRSASRTACSGARGVLGTLSVTVRPLPSSTATRSVKVPPTSTPMRYERAVMCPSLSKAQKVDPWDHILDCTVGRATLRPGQRGFLPAA